MADVSGLPIPDAGPLFLIALGAHVLAGVTCVGSGAVAALSRKGSVLHVRGGRVYVLGLVAVAATMAVMVVIRWEHNAHLVPIGLVAAAAGLAGYLERRSGARHDRLHIVAMGVSYVALLTGFYVDNGPHLPVWNRLPDWSFWGLPSLVGFPIIVAAVRRATAAGTKPPASVAAEGDEQVQRP